MILFFSEIHRQIWCLSAESVGRQEIRESIECFFCVDPNSERREPVDHFRSILIFLSLFYPSRYGFGLSSGFEWDNLAQLRVTLTLLGQPGVS